MPGPIRQTHAKRPTPYPLPARVPGGTTLVAATSFVTRLDELALKRRREIRFDVNAIPNRENRSFAVCYTREELDTMERSKPTREVHCEHCELPIALWGGAMYVVNRKDNCLDMGTLCCKACWAYSVQNPQYDYVMNPVRPQCTCPAGAKACQEIATGCGLHNVPAMRQVPLGTTQITRPRTRDDLLAELNDILARCDFSVKVEKTRYDATFESLLAAIDRTPSFGTTSASITDLIKQREAARDAAKTRLDEALARDREAVEAHEVFWSKPLADFKMPAFSPRKPSSSLNSLEEQWARNNERTNAEFTPASTLLAARMARELANATGPKLGRNYWIAEMQMARERDGLPHPRASLPLLPGTMSVESNPREEERVRKRLNEVVCKAKAAAADGDRTDAEKGAEYHRLAGDYANRFGVFVPDAKIDEYLILKRKSALLLDVRRKQAIEEGCPFENPEPIERYTTAERKFARKFGQAYSSDDGQNAVLREKCKVLEIYQKLLHRCWNLEDEWKRVVSEEVCSFSFVNPFPLGDPRRSEVDEIARERLAAYRRTSSDFLRPTLRLPELKIIMRNNHCAEPGSVKCRRRYCLFQVLREDLEELHAYACAVAAADAEVVREAWDAMSDTT
ncbi:hypothetical protein K438DRAFT_1980279 [Mycena galopus ATCC 62051]|nr:hypothetical protein K438DRAFT_1980279 [Mycena galopus ATCC 62051]